MRSKGGVHKQHYFVLTDETLTFYRKKNDSRAKGEMTIPVKLESIQKYVKKNAFQVTPLKFDKYQWKFIENAEDAIILYADTASLEREWRTKIQSISQKVMEPYIFPDAIDENKDAEIVSNDFNGIQQTMHNKLTSMLNTNYFAIESNKSKWRSPFSLRGLTSDEQDTNELNSWLRIGEVSEKEPPVGGSITERQRKISSASCMAVHNEHNMIVVGARPDYDSSNNGLLSIYNVTVSGSGSKNRASFDSDDDEATNPYGYVRADDELHHTRDDEDHDINLVKSWNIADGIVSVDWRDNILLVSTTEGRVYYYQVEVADNNSTVYLTAHNEVNPSEPVIYTHSALQQTSKYTLLSAPGSWMHSLRIHEVAISRMKSPDCFLCIENESFHLWSLDSGGNTHRPVYSQKASTSPLFAIEWNPHHNHQFMVAGVSTNLKIIDTRELSTNPSKSVPWKVKRAHDHSIRYISWNPLVEYWIASSSDDGAVKIWDTRYASRCVRELTSHLNVVNCVEWSESHCELLVSGSDDRTMKLWNLRSPHCSPHHLLYSHLYSHPVVGVGYSPQRPMQFFGISCGGEIQSVELTDKFVESFVPYRIRSQDNDYNEMKRVELLIYLRDMMGAHSTIPGLADVEWRRGNYDVAQDLLNLVSTVGFQSTLAKYHKQYSFDEMLNKIAPFYHPQSVCLSRAKQSDVTRCEQMKLRMFIRKVLKKKEWKKLLIMEDKIFKHLIEMSSTNCEENMMIQIIELLGKYSYCDAIKWCLRANDVYQSKKEYHLFLPIAVRVLYPTIYHFAPNVSIDPSLVRKSAHILDRKLRDYDFLKWEFNLLYELHGTTSATNIIKIWERHHENPGQQMQSQSIAERESITLNIDVTPNIVLSQTAYRLYFNALLTTGCCDRFFVECTRLSHQNKGYEISYIITDMMDNEGYAELHSYLENQLNDGLNDCNDQIRLRKCCDAVISCVNICENCPELPKCLKQNLPKYLKKFEICLQQLLSNEKNDRQEKRKMIKAGKELCARIKQIQDNKINTEYFFRNEISGLMTTVESAVL